jgi:hypothetical protein
MLTVKGTVWPLQIVLLVHKLGKLSAGRGAPYWHFHFLPVPPVSMPFVPRTVLLLVPFVDVPPGLPTPCALLEPPVTFVPVVPCMPVVTDPFAAPVGAPAAVLLGEAVVCASAATLPERASAKVSAMTFINCPFEHERVVRRTRGPLLENTGKQEDGSKYRDRQCQVFMQSHRTSHLALRLAAALNAQSQRSPS